ncbi:MAG: PAS domain S-box protein [Nitrospiraceae bacterium]|nr:PAS domain S-box protein [Nitrospiraceae bacterium]
MFSFESLINSISETIIVFDNKGIIIFVNRAGEEFFRKSMKEMSGHKFSRLFPDEKIISVLISKTISEERPFSGKGEEIKIGRIVNVDFNLSPFFISDENIGAVISLKENLVVVEREDYQFESLVYLLGTIAHEIKNPLGGIKGAAQLLQSHVKSASTSEHINLIIKETDRLNIVLKNYLTLCRKPQFHSVNIHEVIEKALSILEAPLNKKKIAVSRIYDPSIPKVSGDEEKLLQVFLNMIKNALEATKSKGELSFATKVSTEYVRENGKTKRWAVITIKDTGEGIEPEEIQKIFLPFYTKRRDGTGLGLALSKKIILDHKGFIRVKSQPGKGTTFNIYIPFEKKKQANIR